MQDCVALTHVSNHVAAGRIQGENGELVRGDNGTIAMVP